MDINYALSKIILIESNINSREIFDDIVLIKLLKS